MIRSLCLFLTLVGVSLTAPASADSIRKAQTLVSLETKVLARAGDARLSSLVHPAAVRGAGKIRYDAAFLAAQPKAQGGKEWECLTQALYFEARGERVEGLFAVAEVIMNRVSSQRFPNSVCGVVHQSNGRGCQFSYTCDGHPEAVGEPAAWSRVGKVAKMMLDGAPRGLTRGATYYHTNAVAPKWSRTFTQTASIGDHLFYRNPR
ncbi:cell wall hydrolase [Sagittula salina]|uniref:Cell wall hydrolase n=1 Tax=Sagittula salina TaxID=2820268 RepID=A0A940RZK9_9RHOB|nr:cell wall hydrolase [Sagittula salina]MBP0481097.1 cell wall hydrolase [Sagittula salina]